MKIEKNKKIILAVVVVVVLITVFCCGMFYSKNKTPNRGQFGQVGQNFDKNNLGGVVGMIGLKGSGSFGNMTTGEILSKDAQSFTVKLKDGGSKIVFYTDKTSIIKTTDGTLDDLVIGKNISITGAANPDGSINADSVQIRPMAPVAPQQ